jgi:hypothetical protein
MSLKKRTLQYSSSMKTKKFVQVTTYTQFCTKMQKPGIGDNWNVINDQFYGGYMEDVPAKGYGLILKSPKRINSSAPEDMELFKKVVVSAARNWKGYPELPFKFRHLCALRNVHRWKSLLKVHQKLEELPRSFIQIDIGNV